MTDRLIPIVAPRGIGGLLFIPIAGLVITILFSALQFRHAAADLDLIEGIQGYWAGTAPTEIVGEMSALCLVQIFRRKRSVPAWMTVLYVSAVVCCLVELVATERAQSMLTTGDPDESGGYFILLLVALARAAILIPYFWISSRVANTFVR